MSRFEALYVAPPATEAIVHGALEDTLRDFHAIKLDATERRLDLDIRPLVGVVVVLHPEVQGDAIDQESILAIGQIGDIDNPDTAQLFTLKAASRAFEQRRRRQATDTVPMEQLPWLARNELYRAASASKDGLHVGFAGGWPHHSRRLAAHLADSMADRLALPSVREVPVPYDQQAAANMRAWLDQGQNAGDGLLESLPDSRWDHVRFVLDMIV